MNANETVNRVVHGYRERNGLVNGNDYHEQFAGARTVCWDEPNLKVTRLRLVPGDRSFPMFDVSYCHGELNGERVKVRLPFSQLRMAFWKSEIIGYAKRDGIHAKRLGILDCASW